MLSHSIKTFSVCLVITGLIGPGCVSQAKYKELQLKYRGSLTNLESARANLDEVEALLAEVDTTNESYRQQALHAEQRAAELQRMIEDLEANGGLTQVDGATTFTNADRGEVGYRMPGDVTFAKGSSNLTKEGQRILRDVAVELKKHNGELRIDGHTDTDPVIKTKAKWPEGNIQLGAMRAISVYKFLIGQGLEPGQLSIASYAEHRPAVTAKSEAAKKQNRRVEVVMILQPGQTAG